MPGYERAEVTAELTVVASQGSENSPEEQIVSAKEAAGASGLAHEAGPDAIMLAGDRREVLAAITATIEAVLDAGASGVRINLEAEPDSDRFGGS